MIAQALEEIKKRIKKACDKTGREVSEITIVGITKLHPATVIIESLKLGITNIGESYVQEALPKIETVKQSISEADFKKINWHFVGGLQTNKIKHLKDNFSFIHSIDGQKQLIELDKRIDSKLSIFFEVNLAKEASKEGAGSEELKDLISKLLEINIKREKESKAPIKPIGLMCMPPVEDDPELSRPYFKRLKTTLTEINGEFNLDMGSLSMGMTKDFDIAVEEGATHVRIGTLLYGEREYKKT